MATSTSGDTRRVVDSVVESEDLVVVELRGLDCNDKPAHQKLATCKFLVSLFQVLTSCNVPLIFAET